MENSKVGYEKLLVARSNERYGEIYRRCDLCQRMKNRIEEVVEKLKLGEVPEKP